MPFITPKRNASAATALSWDAFPPPPPEADDWQPDPDSIARPGGLPDPRFNRDPELDRRSKSSRKEAKILAMSQPNGQTQAGNALGRGLGEWPAPPVRSTGHPRAFTQDAKSASPSLEPSAARETFKKQPVTTTTTTTTSKPVARVPCPTKGTMEMMPAPNHRRPGTPAVSKASVESVSTAKSIAPAWAASLEKAIAEDDIKHNALAATTTTATTQILPHPELVRKKSIPPHLRSKVGNEGEVGRSKVDSAQSLLVNLNPNAEVYEALVRKGDNIEDEALAWEVATAETGTEHAQDGLRIQQEILNHYTAKQHVTATPPVAISTPRNPIDHDTKKKVMLIREMEHEMDLEKVAPERELMAMRRAELDRFYDKVCSAHQQWWEAREYA